MVGRSLKVGRERGEGGREGGREGERACKLHKGERLQGRVLANAPRICRLAQPRTPTLVCKTYLLLSDHVNTQLVRLFLAR